MAYKLKNGNELTIKGKTFNGTCRAFVKDVILNRENKEATIIFKIYWSNKSFELENSNYNIKDSEASTDDVTGDAVTVTDYVDYFDSDSTQEELGLTPLELIKKRAYSYINDKELNIGSFIFSDWESDEI